MGQSYVNGENENKNLRKQDNTHPIPSIIFTGHSLGGALATLSSLYLNVNIQKPK